MKRGDVYAARFPHASGARGKKRPVVVAQADSYNQRLRHAVVVQLTTNLADRNDPACLFIEATNVEGKQAGVTQDCVASGYLLSLMSEDRLQQRIGSLPASFMQQIEQCLKAALDISGSNGQSLYDRVVRMNSRTQWRK